MTQAQQIQQIDARDQADIRAVIVGYMTALDSRHFESIAEAFTESAELENTFESYIPGGDQFTGVMARSASQIASAIKNLMGPLDATQHFLGATWFEPTDDGLLVRTQIIAHHHRGTDFYHTGGTYIDSFVRTDEGWRIQRRLLHTSWTTGDISVFAAE
ncbi:nuclear transport factor 2 family protein [Rhodococcus fascians]|nr:nuclear transport factor 2 family protein [Rhodococcus fascians]MBY3998494.1 nuclear transport factor 2 family protein [Rhodococcus fascians]MBY4004512.1 nuclear transport factor 2 family protein [Rhodococcus fascians]MBY4009307.1 nuclear transport factor 2 family protein [Rhodococcus fascians]MBY4019719.1 nuclear transport factor 2 family protein [Rhodococcus fascians]